MLNLSYVIHSIYTVNKKILKGLGRFHRDSFSRRCMGIHTEDLSLFENSSNYSFTMRAFGADKNDACQRDLSTLPRWGWPLICSHSCEWQHTAIFNPSTEIHILLCSGALKSIRCLPVSTLSWQAIIPQTDFNLSWGMSSHVCGRVVWNFSETWWLCSWSTHGGCHAKDYRWLGRVNTVSRNDDKSQEEAHYHIAKRLHSIAEKKSATHQSLAPWRTDKEAQSYFSSPIPIKTARFVPS